MTPLQFYKCMSEDTRLKSLLLITIKGELCVCDLTAALELSQPKVSRHLAELRKCQLLLDERRGKWVYYQLSPELPSWAREVLTLTANENSDFLADCANKLEQALNARSCC